MLSIYIAIFIHIHKQHHSLGIILWNLTKLDCSSDSTVHLLCDKNLVRAQRDSVVVKVLTLDAPGSHIGPDSMGFRIHTCESSPCPSQCAAPRTLMENGVAEIQVRHLGTWLPLSLSYSDIQTLIYIFERQDPKKGNNREVTFTY